MCDCEGQEVEALAGEILRYLKANPSAADTAEGIAQWWVKRQRLEDTVNRVQGALDRLVGESLLEARTSHTGRTLYLLRDARSGTGAATGAGD